MTDAKREIPGLEERFAEVRGTRLRYLVGGEGEPLVLVHGLGGAIALRLAIRRPEVVWAIVLAGAAGISSASRNARYALTITGIVKPGRKIAPHRARVARSPFLKRLVFGRWGAADPPALPPEVVDAFLAGPARHTDTVSAAGALVRDDVRADLDRVRCRVLVLWGARDNQLPVADAFEYARRLRAPLRVIADCGHLLVGERPDACADAIQEFLAGEPAVPPRLDRGAQI